ncbi:MAG TPA: hypothetical protein DCQ50_05740 [Chryseobacterium sp.]|nr:hypothetical protein [Chryseobacterium sp.]
MLIIFYFYLSIIFLCFLLSVYNKIARQRKFWIYFLLVFCFEVCRYIKLISYELYQLSFLFYIPFFIYVFSEEQSNKIIYVFLLLIALLCSINIYTSNGNVQIQSGVLMSFIYIILAILWLFYQLKKVDSIPIVKKQLFWISTSILLIGIISIFKLIPMYYFRSADEEFLIFTKKIYQYSLISCYLFFFKGLICKK